MGIVNITDNSYFSSSRCLLPDGSINSDALLALARSHVQGGAHIIDIGACSSKPGVDPVDEKEEWRRLEPALRLVRKEFPCQALSIDTFRSEIVRRAFDIAGNFIINDISAGEDDPHMLSTAAELGLPYVAMHKRGTSKDMQSYCNYTNVTDDVLSYFKEFAQKADRAGIKEWILDPGFGFAKTIDQNYELLEGLEAFCSLGHEVLVGVSRKSMIHRLFGISPEEALPATQVLHMKALQCGASILRVHDSAEASRTVELWKRLG